MSVRGGLYCPHPFRPSIQDSSSLKQRLRATIAKSYVAHTRSRKLELGLIKIGALRDEVR